MASGGKDTVFLHSTCPSVYVPSIIFAEANSLLKHDGTTTSSIIRIIMNSLIEVDTWSKMGMNYTQIKKEFPNEYASCLGKYILISLIIRLFLKFFNNKSIYYVNSSFK